MSCIPAHPAWRPLVPTDKTVLDRYARAHAPFAEATLATLLVWNDPGGCRITELNGNIVLRHESCGGGAVQSILGPHRTVQTSAELLAGRSGVLELIPDYSVAHVATAEWAAAGLELRPDRDNDDYVFETSSLSTLAGNALKGKRRRRNAFERSHEPELRTLDLTSCSDIGAVLGCAETWFRQVGEGPGPLPLEELAGLTHLLELTRTGAVAGIEGFGVVVGGELVAFSIVEHHGTDIVSGVVFKARRDLPGSGEFLRSASAGALAQSGVRKINAQQDLGQPGLREMKRAYRPSAMLQKWTIASREDHVAC